MVVIRVSTVSSSAALSSSSISSFSSSFFLTALACAISFLRSSRSSCCACVCACMCACMCACVYLLSSFSSWISSQSTPAPLRLLSLLFVPSSTSRAPPSSCSSSPVYVRVRLCVCVYVSVCYLLLCPLPLLVPDCLPHFVQDPGPDLCVYTCAWCVLFSVFVCTLSSEYSTARTVPSPAQVSSL
jgi:hypothetical protein